MRKRTSINSRDVAREAGVSQATVSYVLNNTTGVSIRPETREAVLAAARKLGYYPNQIARGMRLNRSMSVGVVTHRNITGYFFMRTLQGIRDGLKRFNYSLTMLLPQVDDIEDAEFIRYYHSNRIDGVLFVFSHPEEAARQYMEEKGIPFVVVDEHPADPGIYQVVTDYFPPIPGVIRQFKEMGVSAIGYVGPEKKHRVEAFRQAMAMEGMDYQQSPVLLLPFTDEEVQSGIRSMLSDQNRPQAIIAGSPRFSHLLWKQAVKMKIKIPDELKIVALGSSNYYEVLEPSLTAVELPLYDMGLKAAEVLNGLIGGEATETVSLLPSTLVVRDSSG